MPQDLAPQDRAKKAAAVAAAEFVKPDMKVGLGTGSTAAFLVAELARRAGEEGLRFTGVPTSRRTADQARAEGLEITTLDAAGVLDLTIDGADEFDSDFNLIKGGGGALLHEKIVASASARMVVIADPGKEVATLGAFPLPVEVLAFGLASSIRHISDILAASDVARRDVVLRQVGETPYVTDEGNHILDLHLDRIADPAGLAHALNQVPGVVENGLFIGLCDTVIIGDERGEVVRRAR